MGNNLVTQWRSRASQIRHDRDEHIYAIRPKLQKLYNDLNLSSQKEQTLLNAPVYQLVQMLNTNQTTSYELLILFIYRTATIGLAKCWITQENFQQAIQSAKECDEERARTKSKNRTFEHREGQFPQLFGIPLSIKDTIDLRGFSSTIGCTAKYDNKQPEDGVLMQVAKKSGMIPFVKSNLPQLTMTFESVNQMFGRAINPWDQTRTTGGSSGGEAGLVAGRCSPIGMGSDLGGSLRIPAEFCGLYAIKMGTNRCTMQGHTFYSQSLNGNINLKGVIGPIGKSVQDLALFLSVFTDQRNYTSKNMDAFIKLIPFNAKLYKQIPIKLRIGFFDNLNLIPTTPSSRKAVQMVVQRLQKLGHEIVQAHIPQEDQVIGVFFEFIAAEGGLKGYREMLGGEGLIEEYKLMERTFAIPPLLHGKLVKLVTFFKKRLGFLLSRIGTKDTYEYLKLSDRQHQLKKQFIQMWRDKNLDFIICPGFGSQAQKHGFANFCSSAASYTFVWNVLETVVGTMPITRVQQNDMTYGNYHSDPINTYLSENVKGSKGLPVGVQIVGLPYEQEKVLGLMKVIEKEFPFYRENAFPI